MFFPANGGLPTIRIESRVLALEHLRKFELPVERRQWGRWSIAPGSLTLPPYLRQQLRVAEPPTLAFLRLRAFEERRANTRSPTRRTLREFAVGLVQ